MQDEYPAIPPARARPRRSTVVLTGVASALLAILFPTLVIAVFETLCGIHCILQRGTFWRAYAVAGAVLCLLSSVHFVLFFGEFQLSFGWTPFSG